MPGKTIPHILMILLWSPLTFMQAQSPSLNCAFDRMHRQRLAQDDNYQGQHREIEQFLLRSAYRQMDAPAGFRDQENTVYSIPVVIHLFYPPGTEEGSTARPTHSRIRRSIERLNDGFRNRGDYSGGPRFTNAGIEGADVGIEFRLATYDPQGLSTNGIREHATVLSEKPIDQKIKGVEVLDSLRRLSGWPTSRYLNIYVLPDLCGSDGDCPVGFSYQAAAHGLDYDGVYVFSRALQSEQEVLIHEVGHYFNLYHTFESGCDERDCLTGGDRVCDTPPDCYPTNCSGRIPNCLLEERQNTCHRDAQIKNSPFTRDVEDIYENFMDYGFWKCFNSFTPGQRLRMRDALLGFRSSLLETMVQTEPDTCRFTSIEVLATPDCLAPGDTGVALVRIEYRSAPDSGRLMVNEQPFAFGDSALVLPLSITGGEAYGPVEVYFSADTSCRLFADSLLAVPACPPIVAERCATSALTLPVSPGTRCTEKITAEWTAPEDTTGWPAACASYIGRERWFKLEIPSTGELSLEAAMTDGSFPLGIALFESCGTAPFACRYSESGEPLRLMLTGLVPGDTLFAVLWPSEPSASEGVSLCAYLPHTPPSNDQCSLAEILPVSDSRLGQTCTDVREVDFTGATYSKSLENCEPPAGGDVWYKVIIPEEGMLTIKALGDGAAQTAMVAYRSCNGNPVECGALSNLGRPELRLREQLPGDTLLIRVYPKKKPSGTIRLCASIPPQVPSNDDCSQSIPLSVQPSGEVEERLLINNLIVSSSGRRITCQDIPVQELWYHVVVPPAGAFRISATGIAGIISPGLAAFDTCDGKELDCAPSDGDRAELFLEGLTPGDTILIALWDFFQFRYGSVRLNAQQPPPPPNNTCQSAAVLRVCRDSTCVPMMVTGLRRATGFAGLSESECAQHSAGSLWYRLAIPDNGRLVLELFSREDALSGLAVYSSCQESLIDCISSAPEKNDPMQLLLTNLPPGDSLLLSVWSVADSAGIRAFAPDCGQMNTSIAVSPISCNGEADGKATVLPADTSRYSYRWNTGARLPSIGNLPAGLYSVIVSNSYQCRDTLSFSLDMPPPLNAYAESTPSLADTALGSIRVFASGGTAPYSYQLENSSPQDSPLFEDLPPGTYQYWVLDANGCLWSGDATVGLSTSLDLPKVVETFRLYPNPAGDHLNIDLEMKRPAEGRLGLFDALGRSVRQQPFSGQRRLRERWSLQNLTSGIYFIRIKVEGGSWTKKVIIE